MAIKLKLTAEQISNRKFQNVPRGYDALEVDRFLDDIIRDYLSLEQNPPVSKKEHDELINKNKELEQKINALVIENEKLKAKIPNIKDRGNVNQDNIKILKRIDALEKYLWKNGVNPNTIK
ncbi:MAG: DivIVA domain-containing protein [Bacilli bacterium]|nr:DivIVA domain-containing protein [Bacilli bacterium]